MTRRRALHRQLSALLALLIAHLFIGCTPVNNERELLGSYELKLPDGVEVLTLLPNGECTQEIRLKDGKTYSARGRWRYDRSREYLSLEGTRISLDGFGGMNPEIEKTPSGGTGSLPVVSKIFGGFKIGLGENVYYKKQQQ